MQLKYDFVHMTTKILFFPGVPTVCYRLEYENWVINYVVFLVDYN